MDTGPKGGVSESPLARWHHKAKGRFLFRDLAPYFPIFRRPGSVPRSQLIVTSESFGPRERSPRFPSLFRHHIRYKSFLVPSVGSQFPECFASSVSGSLKSFVPGSLASPISDAPDGPCLLSPTGRFLFRLIRKILAISVETIGFCGLFLWK